MRPVLSGFVQFQGVFLVRFLFFNFAFFILHFTIYPQQRPQPHSPFLPLNSKERGASRGELVDFNRMFYRPLPSSALFACSAVIPPKSQGSSPKPPTSSPIPIAAVPLA